jgi:hydroxymethylpyrimidine pyrophosphatase-like HAD family hydrolase
VKRASDHLPDLVSAFAIRTVYTDLDGTLLGPGGSLFATSQPPGVTGEAALAVAALEEAGIDLVLVSGRTLEQTREAARTVGARAFIAEAGGIVVFLQRGHEDVVPVEGARRGKGTAFEAILRTGAAGFLLESFAGRLEPHGPGAFLPHQASLLLRGRVDVEEARSMLQANGYGWLTLSDNGILSAGSERFPWLDTAEVHTYHLHPAPVTKRAAVALHRTRRGLERDECIAVGDSPSDLDVAPEVAAVFVVANGAAALRDAEPPENAYLLDRPHGGGFADAVLPFAERRAGRA